MGGAGPIRPKSPIPPRRLNPTTGRRPRPSRPVAWLQWAVKLDRPAVLVNAGSRDGAEQLEEVVEALAAQGIRPVYQESFEGSDIEAAIARALAASPDALIAGGGDGTVAACAAAAVAQDLPLGVIALGTGNSFARKMGIEPGVEPGVAVLAVGNVVAVDVGRVGETLFLDLFSVGASSDVVKNVSPDLKQRWGRLSYILAATEALSNLQTFRVRIEAESGSTELNSLFVACGPGPMHGGVAALHPDAKMDDGRLYGYALDAEASAVLVQWAASVALGDPGMAPGVATFSGAKISIVTDPPLETNVDGEKRSPTPTTLWAERRGLRVFAPAHSVIEARGTNDGEAVE